VEFAAFGRAESEIETDGGFHHTTYGIRKRERIIPNLSFPVLLRFNFVTSDFLCYVRVYLCLCLLREAIRFNARLFMVRC
jgi:hypothetical protein